MLRYLFSHYYYGEHPAFFQTHKKVQEQFTPYLETDNRAHIWKLIIERIDFRYTICVEHRSIQRNPGELWHLLLDKGMTKLELAEKAGISRYAITKMGKDEAVTIEVLGKICD